MNLIGRGWQYSVYSIGNGRVLKKYNNRAQAYLEMLRSTNIFFKKKKKIENYYRACKRTALGSLMKVKMTNIDKKYFGNPTFVNDLDYEQDLIIPISDYFKQHTLVENMKIVDSFILFNKFLLEQKLIDKSFQICNNFGLNKDGEIVLSDIGELYSDEFSINKRLRDRVWSNPYVLRSIPQELRDYFVLEMDKAFAK